MMKTIYLLVILLTNGNSVDVMAFDDKSLCIQAGNSVMDNPDTKGKLKTYYCEEDLYSESR